jgi:hypothetical protein
VSAVPATQLADANAGEKLVTAELVVNRRYSLAWSNLGATPAFEVESSNWDSFPGPRLWVLLLQERDAPDYSAEDGETAVDSRGFGEDAQGTLDIDMLIVGAEQPGTAAPGGTRNSAHCHKSY